MTSGPPPSTSPPASIRSRPPRRPRAIESALASAPVGALVESPTPPPPAQPPSQPHSRLSPPSFPAGEATSLAVAPTSVNIAELKRKSVPELQELADGYAIENPAGLRKQDLIFRIEQKLLDQSVVLTGEGVLEILPEGYGFLRSQDWNYLYCPDDI